MNVFVVLLLCASGFPRRNQTDKSVASIKCEQINDCCFQRTSMKKHDQKQAKYYIDYKCVTSCYFRC